MYKTIRKTKRNVLVIYRYLNKEGDSGFGNNLFEITLSNQQKKLSDNDMGIILKEMINKSKDGCTYTNVQFFLLDENNKYKYY